MRRMILLFLVIPSCFIRSQENSPLIISEVMFYPSSSSSEFIELYNTSDVYSINLSGYRLQYYTSKPDMIADAGYGMVLPPLSYAVILEGDYNMESGIYKNLIPASALILKISDNAFGSSGMSNSTGRLVSLINNYDVPIDFYTYTADNQSGISDEKIVMTHESMPESWANSRIKNGTPGFRNSVMPMNHNLSLDSLYLSPQKLLLGSLLAVKAKILNTGTLNSEAFKINFYDDLNLDSTAAPDELIKSFEYDNLAKSDSIYVAFSFKIETGGTHNIIAAVISEADEDRFDNILVASVNVYMPQHNYNDVVVNEIMYAPGSDEPEWVEIGNNTDTAINIKNWTISDNSSEALISDTDILLYPDSLVVLCKDTSLTKLYNCNFTVIKTYIPSLNNNGDAVVIKDSLGMIIDSLYYSDSWGGGGGRSLERKEKNKATNDSLNWGTCKYIAGGSPGKINSITQKEYDVKAVQLKFIPEYPFFGEEVEVSILVKNIGKMPATYYYALFQDNDLDSVLDKELLRSGYYNLAPGDSSIHIINYRFLNVSVKTGVTVKIFCAEDMDTSNNSVSGIINPGYFPGTVLINEIMFNPAGKEPEWVELYNTGADTVHFKGWTISDVFTTPVKITMPEDIVIPPESFLVIATDSSIVNYHLNIPSQIIKMNLPLLNNDKDGVVLADDRGVTIDSVLYGKENNPVKGYSLERKSIKWPSTSADNWRVSLDDEQSTPGRKNSITPEQFDLAVADLKFFPEQPQKGDDVGVTVKVLNVGQEPAAGYNIIFYFDADKILAELEGKPIAPGDSCICTSPVPISNLNSRLRVIVKIDYPADQDTGNNFVEKYIEPGYPGGIIKINEIMYAPLNNEPEWIELVNTSASDSVNLNNWTVSDALSSPTKDIIAKSNMFLKPCEYAVISNDSLFFIYYPDCNSKIIIANFGSLGNREDGVLIYDAYENIIDSVFYKYSWGGGSGCSLERTDLLLPSCDSTNWKTADIKYKSTPGKINSVSQKEHDLMLSGIKTEPDKPVSGSSISFIFNIKNTGKLNAEFYLNFYEDTNMDSLPGILLLKTDKMRLRPGDSLAYQTGILVRELYSKKRFFAEIICPDDQDTSNNSYIYEVEPGFLPGALIINEIMYAPESGGPEWIELYNTSPNDSVNLRNWRISDLLPDTSKKIVTSSNDYVKPGGYAVVCNDSSFYDLYPQCNSIIKVIYFGTLGNQEDGIILYDPLGRCIDSLSYKSDWGGNNGRSLERISTSGVTNDPGNWRSSLNEEKCTPGFYNSSSNLLSYPEHSVVINEIMYDPAPDNSEYIELLNLSSGPINVGGWMLVDADGKRIKISESNFVIPPQTFYVVAEDSTFIENYSLSNYAYLNIVNSSWISLSKEGESLSLKDATGKLIDSLLYSSDWQNKNIVSLKNISLEKINPYMNGNIASDWSSSVCKEGGTPGKQNSIFAVNNNTASQISISPNPFSPDNDGFEDFSVINYKLTKNVAQIRIRIFDSKGYLVRTLSDNRPSGSSGSVVFNGLDDNNNPLRMGIYIVLLEASKNNSGVFEVLKTVVVVARKLN